MKKRLILPIFAMLATLAACSDEQTADNPPPPAAEQPSGQPAEPSAAEQAAQKLREAAGLATRAVTEEAGRLGAEAQRRLEEAAPSIDAARQRLSEFAQSSLDDLDSAARDLEQRLRDATGAPILLPSRPEAVLAPSDQLNADTRAAAQARPAGVVPDYVGVWTTDAAACARIDQDAVENFAVITSTTVRRSESVCNITAAPLADGKTTLPASCEGEGETEQRQILIELPAPDTLRIGTAEAPGTVDLTRCHLPG